MRVFIADGAERTSLAIARSLGKRGIEVHCGESYRFSTTALSKYCTRSFIYPDPQEDCTAFIQAIENILKNGEYDAIFSSREVTTIPISYNKELLERHTRVVFPDYEHIIMTHDKFKTFKFAVKHGIPTPKTYFVENMEELQQILTLIKYPVVVKSRFKTLWKNGKPLMLKVTDRNYVYEADKLISVSKEILRKSGFMPLIQEYIPGEGYGVEVLMRNGEIIAYFMHRRLHEYPITGGASTLRESCYNEHLKQAAFKLMAEMNWTGVAMVEFKLDNRDNIPKLIEVNGRFWGSLQLSIASGVDFPFLLYDLLINGNNNAVMEYPDGIKCRWLMPGDFLWFFSVLIKGQLKFKTLREFFQCKNMHYDIISISDPFPVIGALRVTFRQIKDVLCGKRNFSGELDSG